MSFDERWKAVPSLPGVMASTFGRVMVAPFVGKMPHGGPKHYGGKPRKGVWDGSRYIFAHKGKTYKVARLICEAFHGQVPFPRAVCMHLDENSRNNVPANLRWGTQKENLNAPGFIVYCKGRTGENSPTTKARQGVSA